MNFQVRLLLTTSLLLLLSSLNLKLLAATIISQVSGNWSNIGSWGSSMPSNNDDVIISAGTVINLNSSLPVSAALRTLTIQQGGSLIVTVDGSTLRISGNVVNNGVLNLWQNNTLKATIMLYGDSFWSGNGVWNLSSINIQGNDLEMSSGLSITVNGDLSANTSGSFNSKNKYEDISLIIKGSGNSSLPSLAANFHYGNLIINKAVVTAEVNFKPSLSNNTLTLLGDLTLVNSTDRINIGDFNTLRLLKGVNGLGIIGGGFTCSLIIDGQDGLPISPLRLLSGTSLKNFVVNRAAGVVLSTGFNVRDSLILNNECRLVLSSQTLSLGANGTNPSFGVFSGNGYLVGSSLSSISLRGSNVETTYLRFGQDSPSEYTVNNLVIDKLKGITGLSNSSNLIVKGTLDITDGNVYSIGPATLTLNSVCRFYNSGFLKGSEESILVIGGNGNKSYSLQFDPSTTSAHSLKSYIQSRRALISLNNKLNISGQLNLTGDSSIFVSNGNLMLLTTASESSGIAPLLNSADVIGEVNVQVYLSGDNKDMKYRGTRSLSTPINDSLIPEGYKKSIEQLKDYTIITGPGGPLNGFDQGGQAQPFAETLSLYNEFAGFKERSYVPVNNITHPIPQGGAVFLYFRGLQMGSYAKNAAKLNYPYSPPEPVTVTYKGIINKFNIPPISLSNSNNSLDNYNGYNHIGNPYPSTIDWTKVTRSAGVLDEVITIKPGGGTATYLNGFSNNGGSPYIQTGQGFYVRTSVDGGTVSFKETCKTSSYPARLLSAPLDNASLTQDHISKSPDALKSALKVIKIILCDKEEKDETTVVFAPNENAAADYNDAMYFGGSTVNLASLSAEGKRMAINFMPDLYSIDTLKLSVNAAVSGSYSLNFSEVPNTLMSIFLQDSLRRDLTEINKHLSYSFSIDKMNPQTYGDHRFSLIFKEKPKPENTSVSKGANIIAYPNPANTQVFFDSSLLPQGNKQVLIYDLLGRKKQVLSFKTGEAIKADLFLIEPGLYIAKFVSELEGKFLGESLFVKY